MGLEKRKKASGPPAISSLHAQLGNSNNLLPPLTPDPSFRGFLCSCKRPSAPSGRPGTRDAEMARHIAIKRLLADFKEVRCLHAKEALPGAAWRLACLDCRGGHVLVIARIALPLPRKRLRGRLPSPCPRALQVQAVLTGQAPPFHPPASTHTHHTLPPSRSWSTPSPMHPPSPRTTTCSSGMPT